MEALNKNERNKKYLVFLAYFSVLLILSLITVQLNYKTCEVFSKEIEKKKTDFETRRLLKAKTSSNIDSLNSLIKLIYTGQVGNEIALERSIINLKADITRKISHIKFDNESEHQLYKRIIQSIDVAIDYKSRLQQVKEDEQNLRRKLLECIEANKKIKKAYINKQ